MLQLEDLQTPQNFAFAMCLVLLTAIWLKHKPYYPPSKTPQTPGVPFLGSLLMLDEAWPTLPDLLTQYNNKFKKTYCFPVANIGLLGSAVFSIFSEENVQYVLKDNFDNYEKGDNVKAALGEFIGLGIFSTDGALWKHHRKVASNMFSRNLMRQGTFVAIRQLKVLVGSLKGKMDASPGKKLKIDMQDQFFRMTIDIFASIAFGVELDSITGEKPHPFATGFDTVQNLSQKRFKDPFWRIKRALQCSEAERTIKACCEDVNSFAKEVIAGKRREAANAGSGEMMGPDLLSRFLDTKDGVEPPDDNELRDIVMNFMIAGRDTTACALSWTMYELCKNPEALKKVLEEVKSVCGDGGLNDEIDQDNYTYDKIAELKYTNAVAMETLRLHPSVPVDVKFAVNNDTLPDGTFIPKGCTIIYSPYAMGRSEEHWGKDCLDFKPERFMEQGEPSQYKFTTFNAGYRLCLGKGLALLEIKLALAILLARFDFEIADNHMGTYESTLVLPMKPGLMMNITEKKN